MSDTQNVYTAQECQVCLGLHDEEIHDATVAVHGWLRREIARRTDSEPFALEAVGVALTA